MTGHATRTVDTLVRGRLGTVAKCVCGWRSAWSVRDGSAEADAHSHMKASDPEYREREAARVQEWREGLVAQGCKCELLDFASILSPECPLHWRPKTPSKTAGGHQHNCSCHLSAPCGACENCAHWDHPDCENDCQECEGHDADRR